MNTTDKTVTDLDIQALVDNQLGWEEEKKVLLMIQHNPDLRRIYDVYTRQKKLLQAWWKDH